LLCRFFMQQCTKDHRRVWIALGGIVVEDPEYGMVF